MIVYRRFRFEHLLSVAPAFRVLRKTHVPLICDLTPTPLVYKRNFLMRGDKLNKEDDAIDFEVVTELVFPELGRLSRLGGY